ncbi:hypothetical protein E4Q23_14445 [Candidatus Accumulibacter phosphatis]|uniref:Glutamine amidotransferase type-2 domain-containing protein n=1 Tax=Candidatus Accumulibacter phosphatis TaxID=327160 RepID=A0ABX1TZU6_9PROT|nr:hypothetical protein [Candidatus Accumulibacter phosphatis]
MYNRWRSSLDRSWSQIESRKANVDNQPTEGSVSSTSLAKCRGSFSLAHYSAKDDRLYLATDAVGLRSVYYTIQGGFLIFSTALRILEDLPEVRKNLSFLGMAELGVFFVPTRRADTV